MAGKHWKNKTEKRSGDNGRARVAHAKEMMSALHSNVEVVESLREGFTYEVDGEPREMPGCSRSTAYTTLATVADHSFDKQARERMQQGLVHGFQRVLRAAFKAGDDGNEKALATALRTLTEVRQTYRLEMSPEDLLSDVELADQVVKATLRNMHLWQPEQLQALRDQATRLLDSNLQLGKLTE